jgi:hypothetical protein
MSGFAETKHLGFGVVEFGMGKEVNITIDMIKNPDFKKWIAFQSFIFYVYFFQKIAIVTLYLDMKKRGEEL